MSTEIKNLLTENEEVIVDGRVHEIVFAAPSVYLFIAFCVGVFFSWIVAFVIVLVSLYPLYNAYIHYKMTHLILTNKKVMSRQGFLSRDWIRMAFGKIENAYLEEPIIGRQLGYSTVIVSGVGSGSIAVPFIRNGAEFNKALEKQLELHRDKNEA